MAEIRRNQQRDPVRNPNADNLGNLMANADQPVERPVDQTVKKRRLDLLGRERKKVRVKGWEEKLLAKLIKKKRKIGASLNTFRTEYGKATGEEEVPEGQYNFFFKFLRTSTDVRKLPIARNLFLRPILIPLYQTLDLTFITNDSLFWYYSLNVFRGLAYAGCFANVKSIYLCSNKLIRCQKEIYMDEYFFEDFSVAMSSPTWNPDLGTNANNLNAVNNFSAFGKQYTKYTFNNNGDVYALSTLALNDVIGKLNAQKAINMKGKLSEGIKEIKKHGDFFYNGKIKMTDFCPSVLRSFIETNFGALSFFEIDPNAYVDSCVRGGSLIEIPNLVYWDYFHSSMELIGVIKLTTNILEGNNEKKTRFRNAYETYVENKNVFTDYKAHFVLFRKIILMFLDSFRVRANIDKMKEISKLCDDFVNEDERLNEFGEQKSMFRIFCTNIRELATMMFNYAMLGNQAQYIQAIGNVCKTAFRTTRNPGELSNNLRAVCVKVSELLYNGSKPVIDAIRSVNAFLGSMTGGNLNVVMNLAQGLMEQAIDRRNDAQNINERRMRERLYALRELNKRMEPALVGLAGGKTAEQINNDQNLLNMLTDYFDNLRLTEQEIPRDNPVYAVLPDVVKGNFNRRFLNNENNNLRNLLYNENVMANVRVRGVDSSTDEDDMNDEDILEFMNRNQNRRGGNQNRGRGGNQNVGRGGNQNVAGNRNLDQNPNQEEQKEEEKQEEGKAPD